MKGSGPTPQSYTRAVAVSADVKFLDRPRRREAAFGHSQPLFLTQSSATLNAANGCNVGLADYAPPSLLFLVAMLAVAAVPVVVVRTDDSKYLPRNEIFENVPISDYAFAIHEPFDLTRNPVSVSFVD